MSPLHKTGTLQLLQGGREFFPALVKALDAAHTWVQLETYIFDFHGAGAEVAEALVRAAGRGVTVQVLVDGIGTSPLPPQWREKFAKAKVDWCVYSPLGTGLSGLGLLVPERWRRLHRKLCVVDQHTVFCGGINVLDDFYDPNHGELQAPRVDFSVAVTGPLAGQAAEAMALLWWRVQAGYSARQRHMNAAWEEFKEAGYGGRTGTPPLAAANSIGAAGPKAALILRDNLRNRSSIERAYRKAIGKAHHEIIIANAYFLPGGKLRRALISATRRGVRVTLLLQGRYEYFMQNHAARPVYGALLEAGVEIHEYEAGFLHAKVAVVDGHWATVGSSNLDPLSLLLAREANVVIVDAEFAAALRTRLLDAIQSHAQALSGEALSRRTWSQRFYDYLAFAVMRGMLFLTGRRY